jgi:hypothetical protein
VDDEIVETYISETNIQIVFSPERV